MDYLFAYAVEKARKQGYAALAEHERWDWHGDLYGWRRVVLRSGPDERTSPCDPKGEWFDEGRANLAEAHYRRKLQSGAARRERNENDMLFEAREVENKWAQARGYNDFEHYKLAERIDHVDACVRVAKSFIVSGIAMKAMPGKDDANWQAAEAAE